MTRLYYRFVKSLAPLGRLVLGTLVLVLLLALTFGVRSCQTAQIAKTETRLQRKQTNAAITSGADAVNTLGKTAASDAATDTITRENDYDIRNATGANVPVDPASHAAGLRAVCRRAANRSKPECLQQPAP